jgi:uncharacterized membrane protein YphA (DoxX/SURF4 family)
MNLASQDRSGTLPLALLRITLGVIILATWLDNLDKDLYTADGLKGFLDWLFAEDGNGSSLGFYDSLVDALVVPVAGPYGIFQLVVELAIGVGLVLGLMTRLSSLVASLFFFNLCLAYFGGEEWIWTYVLLFVASLVVFLGWGGRKFGVDEWLSRARGESPRTLLW